MSNSLFWIFFAITVNGTQTQKRMTRTDFKFIFLRDLTSVTYCICQIRSLQKIVEWFLYRESLYMLVIVTKCYIVKIIHSPMSRLDYTVDCLILLGNEGNLVEMGVRSICSMTQEMLLRVRV